MSNSLQPHGLQHTRLLCISLSPGVCSNSCPLSLRCDLIISPFATLFFCLQSFPVSGLFQCQDALGIWWPMYWSFSFSISPSNEYSGLISFRTDCFDLLAVQGTLKSLIQYHNEKTSILQRSAIFVVQLTTKYRTTVTKTQI